MDEFRRLTRLPAYVFNITSELKAAARKRGEDIIDFGMGNPDLATPDHIVDKLVEAARNPRNHRYSASRGITKLRHAICGWYKRNYNVELDPETEAIVTIGSKEGLAHLALAMIGPGDVVLTMGFLRPSTELAIVVEHAAQGVMAGRGRAEPGGSELKEITVKENHEFSAA